MQYPSGALCSGRFFTGFLFQEEVFNKQIVVRRKGRLSPDVRNGWTYRKRHVLLQLRGKGLGTPSEKIRLLATLCPIMHLVEYLVVKVAVSMSTSIFDEQRSTDAHSAQLMLTVVDPMISSSCNNKEKSQAIQHGDVCKVHLAFMTFILYPIHFSQDGAHKMTFNL